VVALVSRTVRTVPSPEKAGVAVILKSIWKFDGTSFIHHYNIKEANIKEK
jgi:hypothetical protein